MKRIALVAALTLAAPALAEDKPAAGEMDLSKVGPMSRKVTKEDTKGIDELYKSMEETMKKHDLNAWADLIDFPVVMITDKASGEETHIEVNREQFVKMMTPMFAQPPPKDMKETHKHKARFLSDTLAFVDEDTTMSTGKMKGSWKSQEMVVKKDGKWKVKLMAEAGWGDTMGPGADHHGTMGGSPSPATTGTPPQKTP